MVVKFEKSFDKDMSKVNSNKLALSATNSKSHSTASSSAIRKPVLSSTTSQKMQSQRKSIPAESAVFESCIEDCSLDLDRQMDSFIFDAALPEFERPQSNPHSSLVKSEARMPLSPLPTPTNFSFSASRNLNERRLKLKEASRKKQIEFAKNSRPFLHEY